MPYKTRKPAKQTPPPETEVELRKLQSLYMADKNNVEVREKFFHMLRNYARSIALQKIKRSTTLYLPPERVDEICTDATLDLLEQYSKEGWFVDSSFAGALFWKVQRAMYGQQNDEKNSSLNNTFEDNNNSKEVIDIVSYNTSLPWNTYISDNEDPTITPENSFTKSVNISYNEVVSVVNESYNILPYKTFMRFVPWLVLQFRKPKTRNIQSLFVKLFLTNKEENAFDILLLEIYNRISKHT